MRANTSAIIIVLIFVIAVIEMVREIYAIFFILISIQVAIIRCRFFILNYELATNSHVDLLCRKPQAAARRSRWDRRYHDRPSRTARYRLSVTPRRRVCLTCCQ